MFGQIVIISLSKIQTNKQTKNVENYNKDDLLSISLEIKQG